MHCHKLNVLIVLFAIAKYAQCFDVDIEPNLTIEEIISDNIRLSDSNRQNEFISSIKPNIRILQSAQRINSEINYLLENNNFLNEEEVDIINNLDANSNIEIIDEVFYTDLQVRNSQQNTTNTGIVGTENTSLTDNTDNILTYQIIPSVKTHYLNLVNVNFSYDFNSIDSDRNKSDSDNMNLQFNHGDYFSRLGWNINYQHRTVESENSETVFRRFISGAQYFISPQYSININTGYEDNNFPGVVSDNSGINWGIGATLRPNSRTEIDFSFGERFFGTNYQASVQYSHKRIIFVANYSETPALSRDNLINQQVFNTSDLLGNPLTNPDLTNATSLDVNAVNQNNNVFINRNFDLGLELNHRRYTVGLNGNFSERDFLDSSTETNFIATIDFNYNFNRVTRLNAIFEYSAQDNIFSVERERYRIDLNIIRKLSELTNLNVFIRHTTSDSDNAINNYNENRLGIALNRSF